MERKRTTTGGIAGDRIFEDYDPAVEWSHAADADTVRVSLPGFKKEELRTQVYSNGCVRARGERPVAAGSSRWIRFDKELRLPDNCDVEGIRSVFVDEKLTVTLPKKKTRPSPPDGSATMEEDDDEKEEGQEGTVGKKDGRQPILRLLAATVAAVLFVGITAYVYVVWRKLKHGPGAQVGAGTYINEM